MTLYNAVNEKSDSFRNNKTLGYISNLCRLFVFEIFHVILYSIPELVSDYLHAVVAGVVKSSVGFGEFSHFFKIYESIMIFFGNIFFFGIQRRIDKEALRMHNKDISAVCKEITQVFVKHLFDFLLPCVIWLNAIDTKAAVIT